MKFYWTMTLINIFIVVFFYSSVIRNDCLQIPFISIFPNFAALYFWQLLNKIIDHEIKNQPT